MNYFTDREMIFIKESIEFGLDHAKGTLYENMHSDMLQRFEGTPATANEIAKHARVAARTWFSTFNKKLRNYASELVVTSEKVMAQLQEVTY